MEKLLYLSEAKFLIREYRKKIKWAIPGLFFFIFVFSTQLTEYIRYKSIADDWIWTAGLWCRKQKLWQLSHNHCPNKK